MGMTRLAVEPRTEAWHAVRAESWTASQAAMLCVRENAELLRDHAAANGVTLNIAPLVALGMESFFGHTPWQVWAEKNGQIPRFKGNDATERGQRNEEKVVSFFEKAQMVLVEREVTATADGNPWLLASFDGVVPADTDLTVVAPNGFPLEAKNPAFPSRRKLSESKKMGKLAIMGLPYYWCQVQHQLLVSEAPYGWFVACGVETDKDGVEKIVFPVIEQVPRDDAFLAAYLEIARYYHREFIDAFVEPPKLPSDKVLIDRLIAEAEVDKALMDGDVGSIVEYYAQLLADEVELAERRKSIEAKLTTLAATLRGEGDTSVTLADSISVEYSTSASTSWQKMAKEFAKRLGMATIPAAELETFKGPAKESVKIKLLEGA